MTVGSEARRTSSISGCARDMPMATMPSTVTLPKAAASEPCSGEMKRRPYPDWSAATATPSLKAAKNGLENMTGSGWGVRMPSVPGAALW